MTMCWPPVRAIRFESSLSSLLLRSGASLFWGEKEVGIDATTGEDLVRVNARYFRPTEVEELVGDASKSLQSSGLASGDVFRRACC
jgi:GDP-D-mannose dehydratase